MSSLGPVSLRPYNIYQYYIFSEPGGYCGGAVHVYCVPVSGWVGGHCLPVWLVLDSDCCQPSGIARLEAVELREQRAAFQDLVNHKNDYHENWPHPAVVINSYGEIFTLLCTVMYKIYVIVTIPNYPTRQPRIKSLEDPFLLWRLILLWW